MTTVTKKTDASRIPQLRTRFETGCQGQKLSQNTTAVSRLAQFPGVKFHPQVSKTGENKKDGLSDATNTQTQPIHGYINKIRRNSISGKPKEQKKIPLVATHNAKVSFKPGHAAAGKRAPFKEKKPFTVQPPDQRVHVDGDDLSPMQTESPYVRIRKHMTRVPHGVDDIDAINDPLKCTTYAQDICDYLQAVERRWTFPENYLQESHSPDITPHMRTVLMDWLIQVQVHEELSQHTLHLCVALIDRFLCLKEVQLSMLQLVGITCMLLAAKYHERFPPEISDLCHLTDNTYNMEQVLRMERCILRGIKYDLNMPSPITFLERYLLVNPCHMNPLIQSMSMFLLDLMLNDTAFLHFVPSMLAASVVYVSRSLLGVEPWWDAAFAHYTKYSENDLCECSKATRKLVSKMTSSKFQGARAKYSHSSFHSISNHHSLHISLHPMELWSDGKSGMNEKNNKKCHETLIM